MDAQSSRGSGGTHGVPAVLAAWGARIQDSSTQSPSPSIVGASTSSPAAMSSGARGNSSGRRQRASSAREESAASALEADVGSLRRALEDSVEHQLGVQNAVRALQADVEGFRESMRDEISELSKVIQHNNEYSLQHMLERHYASYTDLLKDELRKQSEWTADVLKSELMAQIAMSTKDATTSYLEAGIAQPTFAESGRPSTQITPIGAQQSADARSRDDLSQGFPKPLTTAAPKRHKKFRRLMADTKNRLREGEIADVAWDDFQKSQGRNGPTVEHLVAALGWRAKSEPQHDVSPKPALAFDSMKALVGSRKFACIVLSLIVINAAVIALQADQDMKRSSEKYSLGTPQEEPGWYKVVDTVFCVVFTLEIVARMLAEEHQFFLGKELWWNLLDLALVTVAVIQVVSRQFEYKLTHIRLVRMLRAFQTLRVVRTFRFLHGLRVMLMTFMRSVFSLMWASLFLFCIVFLFGVVFLQAAASYIDSAPVTEDVAFRNLRSYFQSMPMTLTSLFMSTTGGLDWSEIYFALKLIGDGYGLLFLTYVVIMTIGILNVIIGVSFEGANSNAQLERERSLSFEVQAIGSSMNELKTCLQMCGAANGASLGAAELEQFLDSTQAKTFLQDNLIDDSEAQGLFKLLATTTDQVSIDEYVICLMVLKGGNSTRLISQWCETRQLMTQIGNFIQYSREHFNYIEEMLGEMEVPLGDRDKLVI